MLRLIEKIIYDDMKKIIKETFPEYKNWKTLEINKITDTKYGDFQTNFAMVNAKHFKKNPREIASQLIQNSEKGEHIKKIDCAGPGFINIYIKDDFLSEYLNKVGIEEYDFKDFQREGKVILDYSSPNIAKRMHIAHLRSTVIGDSIKRIFGYLGYETIADNHLGDWGTQFGMLIVAYRKWLDKQNYEKDPVGELERLYIKFGKEAEKEKSLKEKAREELKKLQHGDKDNLQLWKEFVEVSLEEYKNIYNKLDIEFDTYHGESFFHEIMPDVVEQLKEKELIQKDKGALVHFFDENDNLHPAIIQKKDGAYLYTTSDLACIKYRVENYDKINRMVYVTDIRQETHFKQVFKIAEELGWEEKYDFVAFGLMESKEGIFSSRKGNVIKLKDLINKAVKKAKEIVDEKNPNLKNEMKDKISETVGIGAIKYNDLSQNRISPIHFDWDDMLNFEGNTAPYLQYVYVRVQSLLRMAEKKGIEYKKFSKIFLTNPTERALALLIVQFPNTVKKAAEYYKPNIIADYLFNLAQAFNSFYNSLSILREDEKIMNSRILLSKKVAFIIKEGLNLLGIKVVEKM